jgi:putative colanic acid biosynthesis UDP-glucose lipid carrier transferase
MHATWRFRATRQRIAGCERAVVEHKGFLKEHSSGLNASLHCLDWAAVVFGAILSHQLYLKTWALPPADAAAVLVAWLASAWLFPKFRLYRAWRGLPISEELKRISFAWVSVFALMLAIAFALKAGDTYSRGWIGTWLVVGWSWMVAQRLALRMALRWLRANGFNLRRVVLVGYDDQVAQVAERLRTENWHGLRVVGTFSPVPAPAAPGRAAEPECRGSLAELVGCVASQPVEQVWIVMPLREEERVRDIMDALRNTTVDIRLVPDLFGLCLLNHGISEVAGLPVIDLSATPMTGTNQLVKAIEDRALASVIVLLLSPLMALLALGVKLGSPGPVLFRQLRHGWDGKPIEIYKFRTMYVHTEPDGAVTQARRSDPRVTPFGAFLRRTSLDELPQFINVLQGRMSIVGPRPHALSHNEQYKDLIDGYMLRHKVKPGITGWAQVNGWRGETDTLEKMRMRVEHDLYYIDNWSLWFDLRIISMTLFKGFAHRAAY